jgi:formylglycine-generating enzyme required for sulfatase activity
VIIESENDGLFSSKVDHLLDNLKHVVASEINIDIVEAALDNKIFVAQNSGMSEEYATKVKHAMQSALNKLLVRKAKSFAWKTPLASLIFGIAVWSIEGMVWGAISVAAVLLFSFLLHRWSIRKLLIDVLEKPEHTKRAMKIATEGKGQWQAAFLLTLPSVALALGIGWILPTKPPFYSYNNELAATFSNNMVRIPGKNYEIGKYTVTQAEWQTVMGYNPSFFLSCGDTCPVDRVSWNMVQTFIQKLNAKTGGEFRLPTEAEWEYACYGGTKTEYCGGNDLNKVGWINDSFINDTTTTHPVGEKQANSYGLYDMSGNVLQWMQDKDGARDLHMLRGGIIYTKKESKMSAASRISRDPETSWVKGTGFRLARTIP